MPMWGGGYSGVISPSASSIATYRVDFGALVFTTGGSNQFVQIIGSATKLVKVIQIFLWKPSTTIAFSVLKQSTASTGGTATTPTPVPLDSTAAAATAVVSLYTAPPAAGAAVGVLYTINVTAGDIVVDTPGDNTGSPILLRSAAESLVLRSDTSATLRGFIEFTES